MIYPKRKKLKAASGMDMSSVESVNAAYNANQEKDNKISAGLTGAVSQVPGYGALYGTLAGIGTQTSKTLRGDKLNSDQDSIHASQITDPWFQFKDNKNAGDWISSFLFTPAAGIVKGKRKADEAQKLNQQLQIAEGNQVQKESNETYGQLSYKDGGELLDREPDRDDVQDQAVVLGGESHANGGNAVVDADTGEKVAETEKEELLFTKEQTESIEKQIALYVQTKDQTYLVKLGEIVQDIVRNQMKDYSGKYSK